MVEEEAYKVLFTRLTLIIHQKALALHHDDDYDYDDSPEMINENDIFVRVMTI